MEYNLYESHMGGFFAIESDQDDFYDYDVTYCETCNDSDVFLGSFDASENIYDNGKEWQDFLKKKAEEFLK